MRMRRKRHLEERLAAHSGLLLARGRPCLNLKEAAEHFRARLDFSALFGNDNPVRLEIGCGSGGFIARLARREPEYNYLAVEVCSNVIVTAIERIADEGIGNVRFLNIAAEILPCYIPEESVDRIYLNFSTPLPAKGCEKQRLTSARFLQIDRSVLKEGGCIEQKTDSERFFDYSLAQYAENGFEVVEVTRDLHNSSFAGENIVTEYEEMFLRRGLPIYRAVAVKR